MTRALLVIDVQESFRQRPLWAAISNPGIAERADNVVRIIFDTYVLPNKSFQEVRAMMQSGALDPLRDFSEACHEELSLLSSQALQFKYRRA